MATEVPDKYQNVNRRGRPPKKEKLFRKRPTAMVGFVEKKQVIQRGGPVKKKSMAMIGYVEKKQVECDKRKMSNSLKRKREQGSHYDDSAAMRRAREIQESLGPEFPSFVKYMLPSHVVKGFWLGLPSQFCHLQLPKKDIMITLEDDIGVKCEAKYLFEKGGLSAGWRGYSMDHNLVEGDVLVFHLVTPSKLKIYTVRCDSLDKVDDVRGDGSDEVDDVRGDGSDEVDDVRGDGSDEVDAVRAEGSDEVDCALGLLELEVCTERMNSKDAHCLDHLLRVITPESTQNDISMVEASSDLEPISESDRFGSENEADLGAEVVQSDISFEEVKSIDSFNITVNGVVINSKFPKHILTKYFDLCRSQHSYLHKHLLDGTSLSMAIGVITEIANIADGIRASNITTPQKELVTWDTALKGFEIFGMDVSFLRARIDRLMSLIDKLKQCGEAKRRRVQERKELRMLVLHVKELIAKADAEIESLHLEKLESVFHEVANGPWGLE